MSIAWVEPCSASGDEPARTFIAEPSAFVLAAAASWSVSVVVAAKGAPVVIVVLVAAAVSMYVLASARVLPRELAYGVVALAYLAPAGLVGQWLAILAYREPWVQEVPLARAAMEWLVLGAPLLVVPVVVFIHVRAMRSVERARALSSPRDQWTLVLFRIGVVVVICGVMTRLLLDAQWHVVAKQLGLVIIAAGLTLVLGGLVLEHARARFLRRAYGGRHPDYEVSVAPDEPLPIAPLVTTCAPLDRVLTYRAPPAGDGPHRSWRPTVAVALLPSNLYDALAPSRRRAFIAVVLCAIAALAIAVTVRDLPRLRYAAAFSWEAVETRSTNCGGP